MCTCIKVETVQACSGSSSGQSETKTHEEVVLKTFRIISPLPLILRRNPQEGPPKNGHRIAHSLTLPKTVHSVCEVRNERLRCHQAGHQQWYDREARHVIGLTQGAHRCFRRRACLCHHSWPPSSTVAILEASGIGILTGGDPRGPIVGRCSLSDFGFKSAWMESCVNDKLSWMITKDIKLIYC